MGENRPISHAEEFQICDIGNFALREMECNSLFLKSELHILTSFPKTTTIWNERKRVT